MGKIHSPHVNISNLTRCGISLSGNGYYHWTEDTKQVTCKRCLVNIKWEVEGGGRIIIAENERD